MFKIWSRSIGFWTKSKTNKIKHTLDLSTYFVLRISVFDKLIFKDIKMYYFQALQFILTLEYDTWSKWNFLVATLQRVLQRQTLAKMDCLCIYCILLIFWMRKINESIQIILVHQKLLFIVINLLWVVYYCHVKANENDPIWMPFLDIY